MSVKIIEKQKVNIAPSILEDIESFVQEEGQVILHFIYETTGEESLIRIWPTTYLIDQNTNSVSSLIHSENITMYPTWTLCPVNTKNYFTLIFSGLPKSCTKFDFIEYCNGNPGAFEVRDIPRNNTDVYLLKIS